MESGQGRRNREDPRGLLHLNVENGWTVEELHSFLQSLRYAHASISLALQEGAPAEDYPRYDRRLFYREWENRLLFSDYESNQFFDVPYRDRFRGPYDELLLRYRQWHRATTMNRFGPRDDLLLNSITIESPGWIEVIGNLNPLLFIEKLILICRDWRSERERRTLENLLPETDVLQRRINVMRESGFGEAEIKEFVSNHIQMPLSELQPYGDKGLVVGAKTKALEGPEPPDTGSR